MMQYKVKVLPMLNVLISLLQWEKVARFAATDEVLLQYIAEANLYLAMFAHRRAPKSEPRGLP